MNNETIDVDSLDLIMKLDKLKVNLDLFETIFDNMSYDENTLFNGKKSYFMFVFEQILLSSGSISELEAKDFISLIKSREFLKSYIEIVTNLNYKPRNSKFTAFDGDKISRKNNPLFQLGELETKLNTLIIKSRLQDSLNNQLDFASLEGDLFVNIDNESYKVKENKEDYYILTGVKDGKSGLFKKVGSGYEQIVNGYENIEFDFDGKNKFARLGGGKANILYDLEKNESILVYDNILSYSNIGNRLLVNYIFHGNNIIYDIKNKEELFSYSNAYYNLKIHEVINDRFLLLKDEKSGFVLFDTVKKVSVKNCISSYEIDENGFFFYNVNDLFIVYDLNNAEEIAYSYVSKPEVIKIGDYIYIEFIDVDGVGLLNYKTGKKIYGKKYLKFHIHFEKTYIEFEDYTGFGICEILSDDFMILLEGKKELIVDQNTGKVKYKNKGLFESYKKFSL